MKVCLKKKRISIQFVFINLMTTHISDSFAKKYLDTSFRSRSVPHGFPRGPICFRIPILSRLHRPLFCASTTGALQWYTVHSPLSEERWNNVCLYVQACSMKDEKMCGPSEAWTTTKVRIYYPCILPENRKNKLQFLSCVCLNVMSPMINPK